MPSLRKERSCTAGRSFLFGKEHLGKGALGWVGGDFEGPAEAFADAAGEEEAEALAAGVAA